MNAQQEARLDAQARQMAFEMGYGTDPRAEQIAYKAEYARREAEQERAAYQAKMDRDSALVSLRPATEKQIAFIKRLVAERVVVPGTDLAGHLDLARHLAVEKVFTTHGASKLIDALLAAPKKSDVDTQKADETEPEDGIYILDDASTPDIFKVYKMVHGSGRQGLKRLIVDRQDRKGHFEYEGLALYKLPKQARKMTLEEAKAFGAIYGFCVRCGRTLTDETSIANGIGPICAEQM